MKLVDVMVVMAAMFAVPGSGAAQDVSEAEQGQEQGQEQDSLKVYFGSGSAQVIGDQLATLDQAARLFREGSPIVMIVAGGADTVGLPDRNLALSIRRAQAVVDGLVERGIPADRLQVLGRGTSELEVETPEGVDNPENRVAEITWR